VLRSFLGFREINMKCVLTVAGLGTRLLPLTKEIPKEMLPIYEKTKDSELILKPILQVIFESLYDYNIRDFCFIVGKTKRSVEDHFTPNSDLVELLQKERKRKLAKILKTFFKKLEKSNMMFTTQPKPIGFGDAISYGEKFVGEDDFLLHAGDDIVISNDNSHLKRLNNYFKKYNADIACLIEEVDDPSQYGVVSGPLLEKGVIEITNMVEKPKKPKSKYAIIAIYQFKPKIFKYLKKVKKESNQQNQLANAFNLALKNKDKMIGVILNKNEKRMDIGTPETYSKILTSMK
jgi:UTP--glucose-1-phosphate uridylyltransferase